MKLDYLVRITVGALVYLLLAAVWVFGWFWQGLVSPFLVWPLRTRCLAENGGRGQL